MALNVSEIILMGTVTFLIVLLASTATIKSDREEQSTISPTITIEEII
jgi:hypothetical protein